MASDFDDSDCGVEVQMGRGRTLRLFPLTFGVRRRRKNEWAAVFGGKALSSSDEWWESASTLILESANLGERKYSLEEIEDLLDMVNVRKCFTAMAGVNGMKSADGGEASGEPRPTKSQSGEVSTQP